MIRKNIKKLIVFLLLVNSVSAYSQTINGIVKNGDKNNLVGVVIGIEGESIGDVTDENGSFKINLTEVDKTKNLIAYLGGYESYKIKISDFINQNKPTIILKGKIIDLQEVVLTPQKTIEKNLGISKKSKIKYCGYDSKEDNSLFKEYAIKIKNKKKIKIKNINIMLTDYNIETSMLLMFDIYSNKDNLPNESLIGETLSKKITNTDIKNNVISLDVSDKNIWIEEDFFVSVRVANDFKGYLFLSGNILAMSQNTYNRLYNGSWSKYSGAPSINLDVLIKK